MSLLNVWHDWTMTNMFDLFTEDNFTDAEEAGLIKARPDGNGLLIWNYTDRAMFTPGAWDNPAVRVCRGLIVEADTAKVVARPWAKFFNYGQGEAGVLDLDAPVEVTEKVDGSLGVIFNSGPDGYQKVASRGSFESDQAIHATQWLEASANNDLLNTAFVTPLVEIVYPENRIVCDYQDADELVLLGGVIIETGEYMSPDDTADITGWNGPMVDVYPYATLREALDSPDRKGAEGFCIRFLDRSHIVKLKYPEYVALHKIVTGLSERSVWEHMVAGKSLDDLLAPLPDELHDWTRQIWAGIDGQMEYIAEEVASAYADIVGDLPDGFGRGEFAAQAKTYGPVTGYLFSMLDGRNVRPMILKSLKPAGMTRAKTVSEDVA